MKGARKKAEFINKRTDKNLFFYLDSFCCVSVQVRVAFEEFSGHATQMLARLEEMQETVSRKDFPQDLEGARRMIEEHATLKKKVIKAPIEELDTEGQR